MSFPQYSEYRYSGVAWLGKVPSHWQVARMKFVASVQTGIAKGKDNSGKKTVEVPYLRVANVQDGYLDLSDVAEIEIPADDLPRYQLKAGDVLMNEGGDFDKLGRGHIWDGSIHPCIHQNHVFAVRPFTVKPQWLNLVTSSAYAQFYFMSRAKQSTNLASISSTNIMELPLVLPTVDEQTTIATFLDYETAKIDALVAEQEKLIALLQEKRQAVISHAVTKGMDPNVPMKDSGVEWLGKIPAHWECIRLKQLVIEAVAGPYGASLTKAMYAPQGYRVYGQQQAIADDFSIGDYYISVEKYGEMRRYTVSEGDVLISVMGTIGKVAVVPPDAEPGIINPRLVRYRCGDLIEPRFLQRVLMSQEHQEQLFLESNGTTMDGLNMLTLGRVPIPTPPIGEQVEILKFLKAQAQEFDPLILAAQAAIALLQERRTALISAAVTGQIDVRGLVPMEVA